MTTDRRLLKPVLDTARHTYTLDGRPLAGVTTAIHAVLRAPELEEWFKRVNAAESERIRDEAAAFGNSVHAAMKAVLEGHTILPLDQPEAWWATIKAGAEWLSKNVVEVLAVEETIASRRYGYAGKPDLYAILAGARIHRSSGCPVPTIVDFKTTGDVYWEHAFQTAAYRKACVETYNDPPADRLVLRFDKEQPGLVVPRPFTQHDRDFAGFGYCLGLYNCTRGGM